MCIRDSSYAVNGLNQYTGINGAQIVHDGNGNITTDVKDRRFTYDASNVLREVKTASGASIATYLYYADGSRRAKVVGSATSRFYYTGDQEIAEYDGAPIGTDKIVRRYVRLPGSVDEPIVMIDYNSSGSETSRQYAHQNRLGSVVTTTDTNGTTVDTFTYSPYGVDGSQAGTTASRSASPGKSLTPKPGSITIKQDIMILRRDASCRLILLDMRINKTSMPMWVMIRLMRLTLPESARAMRMAMVFREYAGRIRLHKICLIGRLRILRKFAKLTN